MKSFYLLPSRQADPWKNYITQAISNSDLVFLHIFHCCPTQTNKAAPQYCPLSPWCSIWANHHRFISSIPSLPESITLNTHSTTNLLRLEVQKDSCFPWTCIDAIFNHRRAEAVIQTLRQPFTKVYQTSNTLQGSEVAVLGHFMPTDRYQVQEKKSQNSLTENQLLYK